MTLYEVRPNNEVGMLERIGEMLITVPNIQNWIHKQICICFSFKNSSSVGKSLNTNYCTFSHESRLITVKHLSFQISPEGHPLYSELGCSIKTHNMTDKYTQYEVEYWFTWELSKTASASTFFTIWKVNFTGARAFRINTFTGGVSGP